MDTSMFVIVAVIVVISVSISITALMLVYERFRRAREREMYNQEKMRAEIGYLRSNIERQLYEVTDRLISTEDRWKDVNHLLISSQRVLPDKLETLKVPALSEFLLGFGITAKELTVEQDLVFVLTPFHESKRATFNTIVDVCRAVGLRCLRGDEEYIRGDILQHIVKLIVKARIIVANIDGRNPNVFYELGIVHAIDKPTIIISRSIPNTTFDVKSKHMIVYKDKKTLVNELKTALAKALVKE